MQLRVMQGAAEGGERVLEVGLTGMDCKEALGRDWHVPALAGPDSTAALILLQGIVYHDAA